MKTLVAALVAATMLAGVARAEDKPLIGPVPAWVRPVLPPAGPAGPSEAAVHVMLFDQQVALDPGQVTLFNETILQIQTPQGLAAGNISLAWRPETDTLTVHKVLIRRGDQTINVLASGQTFTVLRREQNLESATLDGVLTANIQPEGLQVGDVIEFSASVTSRDPVMQGHVEQIAGGWTDVPIGRAHVRLQWPAAVPARLRATKGIPALKPVKAGSTTHVEFTLDNVEPLVFPKGAPPRYRLARVVEASDFASWAELGALMAPLYEMAAIIPAQGPLRAELERIQSLSPDPVARTEAALTLVQDRVRYVALAMGAGGYVPATAELTWSRRFGDCKGKTALLLALLSAMGITAEPVLVSTTNGDGLDERLPMVRMFNHVLVRATIGGRTYWLDGTRTGDASLARLTVPNFGWGLPVLPKGAVLVRMLPPPLAEPTVDTTIRIDATAGISVPAPTRIETIMRGDEAIALKAALANFVGDARDRALKAFWKEQYDFIEVKTASASFDARTGEQRLFMEGESKLDWANGNYQTDGTNVGYDADFSRDPGADTDAPFAVSYPRYSRVRETILLPKGPGSFKLGTGMEVDQTAGGIAYKRHASIADGVFTIERSERAMLPEFPARDAPAEQAALRMLYDKPAQIRMPASYSYTGKDVAAVRAEVPTTSAGYVSRAKALVDRDLGQEALLDYDKAIELDPNNASAWANRAITRIQQKDRAGARRDIDKAAAIDPDYVQTDIARALLAADELRWQDAVDAYSTVLQREPGNRFAISHRAEAYYRLGNSARAEADYTAVIEKRPDDAGVYVDRGNFYLNISREADAVADFNKALAIEPANQWALADRGLTLIMKGDFAAAKADLDAAAKVNPKNPVVMRARGMMAQMQDQPEAAIAAYTQSLAVEPDNAFALGHRAEANRAAGHDEQALLDAAAALKRNPAWVDLYLLRANLLRGQGKQAEALAEAESMTAANPNSGYALVAAASIYSAFQRSDDAMRAYDRALAIRPEAYIYLNRAQRRPADDLAGRLADFDAALKLDPTYLPAIGAKAAQLGDSGDWKAALATYDAGLAKFPDHRNLLVGRGVAHARIGDKALAIRDFEKARAAATDALSLNEVCWAKATTGLALESALADCNAALEKAPGVAGYLDSRAMVYLRLGRPDEAIADYDAALAKVPDQTASLFGRAIAWSRKGDKAKAEIDAAAALKIAPGVRAEFEGYGVTM